MAEVRQFKLTEPLETKELVDWRQTLEVKLALLRPPPQHRHHHSCYQCLNHHRQKRLFFKSALN